MRNRQHAKSPLKTSLVPHMFPGMQHGSTVKGRRNVVVDCLSRLPIDGSVDEVYDTQLEAFSIDGESALVEFVKGRRNVVVDCLSRLPIDGSVDEVYDTQLEAFSIDGESALGEDEWEEAIRNDVEYDELRKLIMGKVSDEVRNNLKQYLMMSDELSVQDCSWFQLNVPVGGGAQKVLLVRNYRVE
ncbi:hypothetical protein NDU88_004206 [Pleurodeles waltl]|uniref:Uncharacterized protein n=1 Tax=Pleurodeles waltl TaxID=8319 RepID=A0AAV7M6C4_PLEWA|nr:hypothetical protein NDU88_004206 [Pleurodeles waltl]